MLQADEKTTQGELKEKLVINDYRFLDPNDSFVNFLLFKFFCFLRHDVYDCIDVHKAFTDAKM